MSQRQRIPARGDVPPATFKNFVTELASTALVCLGYLQSPVSGRKAVDLPRAAHVVQLLAMLEVKTHGNLNEHELDYLTAVVQDLEIKLQERTEEAAKGKSGTTE